MSSETLRQVSSSRADRLEWVLEAAELIEEQLENDSLEVLDETEEFEQLEAVEQGLPRICSKSAMILD